VLGRVCEPGQRRTHAIKLATAADTFRAGMQSVETPKPAVDKEEIDHRYTSRR
jgi:hypothetical protein